MPFELSLTIGEIGEKRLIREFVRPFFDGDHDQQVIGHDCAIVGVPDGYEALARIIHRGGDIGLADVA